MRTLPFLRQIILSLSMCLICLTAHTVRAQSSVDTYFIDKHGTLNGSGAYWYQEFTIGSTTTVVLRMTADFTADAAIFTGSQLNSFTSGGSYSGFALFDGSYGTKSTTLSPGTYYVGIRNGIQDANPYRLELDYDIRLQDDANFTYSYVDVYAQGTEYVNANGGKLWHGFTIQNGFRYFVDGCNTGLGTYVIPESQLSAFRNGQSFDYFSDYSGTNNAYPGLHELKLAPGTYYLAFVNDNPVNKPLTYTLERWRQTPMSDGGGGGGGDGGSGTLDLSGGGSWKTSGSNIEISVGKVTNNRSGGKSGTLRLQVWATDSPYTGGGISGYILGTYSLGTLSGGYNFSNVSGTVPFKAPPDGTYHTTITLEEYNSGVYGIADHITFSSTSTFGGGGGGGSGGGGGDGGKLDLTGKVTYKITGKTCNLAVGRLTNTRTSGTSGSLKLRLWATKKPYTGGTITGWPVALQEIRRLDAGKQLTGIKRKTAFKKPPKGRYFMTLVLEEYSGGQYRIVDFVKFTRKYRSK